jgi:hypothetical protein
MTAFVQYYWRLSVKADKSNLPVQDCPIFSRLSRLFKTALSFQDCPAVFSRLPCFLKSKIYLENPNIFRKSKIYLENPKIYLENPKHIFIKIPKYIF